jgi:MFS family permease
MMTIFNLQFLFSALIEMGFPIIFQAALLVCSDGTDCEEPLGCDREGGWVVSSTVKSVAYTFDLVCERKRMLGVGFDAFLYGGFFGSFYYGEIIERRGRRYAVLEAMMIMIIGIIVSLVSGNITLWSIGMFFVNFGFRGYYNAAVLSLT